ncbi:hypothetical protein [Pseudoalteromonas ruthenica]|uniref:hypothetical protein n=1 Tax=Pseudoalteromonas ruthenica TaxID=151081 RepID=UPI00110BBBE9|nr:hypothetical protein [Pseudoalteromonas ruthenica]TMP02496.1 hypothetical protein CWC09_18940 [Pseudoalteromonas ruthenica]
MAIGMQAVLRMLDSADFQYTEVDTYRFSHGVLPQPLTVKAKDMSEASKTALRTLNKLHVSSQ